jgi:hypothetical protein
MKKLLLIGALLCVLCACGSGNTKKHSTSMAGSHNGHEWVDLGLPSGLKWATCNVGASTPEEYGDYFAWGEIRTKSEFLESNCVSWGQSWGDIGGNSSRDAATANWGGKWRMPNEGEYKELLDNCAYTWTTQNGCNGLKVVGPNGQSIFLPAADEGDDYLPRDDGPQRDRVVYGGEFMGKYWSSSPEWGLTDQAIFLCFYPGGGGQFVDWECRSHGLSVRPVLGD